VAYHVFPWLGHPLNSIFKKLIREGFENVTFVSEKFAAEIFSNGFYNLEAQVIHVSFDEIKRQNFPLIGDYQVQFESEKLS